ncbi:MAG: helix-turn-helix domain-containing protein [Gemmatimonadales bacterium]
MTDPASVRFWQPAGEAAAELVCAYLEPSESPLHLHEEWQFGVLDAPGRLSLGAFRRHPVDPGDVTVLQPYAVHGEGGSAAAPPRWRILYVAPAIVNRLYGGDAPRLHSPVASDPVAAAELRELLRLSADGTLAGSEFLSRVDHWLEDFLRRHAEAHPAPRPLPPVQRARSYLQDRPTETVTLAEVGAVAGVTLSHLVRSFSRTVGLPPRSYHAQVRLARARRLLAEGKPATWVAYECGFADQSHLNRRFKECHGVTPGAFQAQYCGQRISLEVVEPSAA